MKSFTMYIDIAPPSANTIWKHAGKWTYVTPKYREFRTYVRNLLSSEYGLKEGNTLIGDKPYAVSFKFQFKGKRKRDVSNYIKPLEDTFEGHLYNNDEQCYKIVATRTYNSPEDGVEITYLY